MATPKPQPKKRHVTSKKSPAPKKKSAAPKKKSPGRTRKPPVPTDPLAGIDLSKRPNVREVTLKAPRRTGRAVTDLGSVLKKAETRLIVAWHHREALAEALPDGDSVHEQGWTALKSLQRSQNGTDTTRPEITPAEALEGLRQYVSIIRKVVADMTSPGDPVRADFRFGVKVLAQRSLIDVGSSVLDASRKHRELFPALTPRILEATETALNTARRVVEQTDREQVERAVRRATVADEKQLALDVLLWALDTLRAAARVTLAFTRPQLAAVLLGALEDSSKGTASDEDDDEEDEDTDGEEDTDDEGDEKDGEDNG